MPPTVESTAFRRGLWAAFGVLVAVALAYGVVQVRSVLVLVAVAVFLAMGLHVPVRRLTGRGLPRWAAVTIVTVITLGLLVLIGVILVRVLAHQVSSLIDNGPRLLHELMRNRLIHDLDQRYHVLSSLQQKLADPKLAQTALGHAFGFGLGAVNALANVVVVLVLTVYFLAGLPQLTSALLQLAPAPHRPRVGELTDEIVHRTGRYVVGVLAVAAVAGTVTFSFLMIVGIRAYALPLALLVALLDLVPLVGALVGAGCVIAVCFANSVAVGVAAASFYLLYEITEGYLIYPRVMRSSVDVPEYVTIIAVLVGGSLGGVVGALLSLPITAAGLHLIKEVWVPRQDAV